MSTIPGEVKFDRDRDTLFIRCRVCVKLSCASVPGTVIIGRRSSQMMRNQTDIEKLILTVTFFYVDTRIKITEPKNLSSLSFRPCNISISPPDPVSIHAMFIIFPFVNGRRVDAIVGWYPRFS